MASAPHPLPPFIARAAKFAVGAVTIAITVGGPYFDILRTSDFTSVEGLVKAAVAVAGALGIYGVRNAGT